MSRIFQGVMVTDEQYAEWEANRIAAEKAAAEGNVAVSPDEPVKELTRGEKAAATRAANKAAKEAEKAAEVEGAAGSGDPVEEAESLPSGDARVEALDVDPVDAAIDAAEAE